jgi:nitric oxide reductase NorE protein
MAAEQVAEQVAERAAERAGGRHVPGEVGIWVLIGGELAAFSAFFVVFAYYRGLDRELFQTSHAMLDHGIGLVNTVILLTSSLFVALGVQRVRDGREGAARWLRLALLCGGAFGVLKVVEYWQKVSAGITPLTNDFFMYYFAFTGVHLLHVVIGSGALLFAIAACRKEPSAMRTMMVECAGIFWHLVDLLWIILFALFYLAGGNG